ncbi:MAG: hypothetical protein LBR44_02315 [Clostridiales Family XIII bacterium]|nr:hypothetical protein [Clostridiales Family XIII bacterium]
MKKFFSACRSYWVNHAHFRGRTVRTGCGLAGARREGRVKIRPAVCVGIAAAIAAVVLLAVGVIPAAHYGEFTDRAGFEPPGKRTAFDTFKPVQKTGAAEASQPVQTLEWEPLYTATYQMDETELANLREQLDGLAFEEVAENNWLGRRYVHHEETCEAFQVRVWYTEPREDGGADVTVTVYSGGAYYENESRWVATYGGNLMEAIRGIAEAEDGTFIAVGTAASKDGDVSLPLQEYDKYVTEYDAMVARTTADGELLYMKKLGFPANSVLHAVVRTPQGDFIAVGRQRMEAKTEWSEYLDWYSDFLIVRFDIDGEILWSHSFGGNAGDDTRDMFKAVTLLEDGGFAAAGMQGDVPVIMKFDANGTRLWAEYYTDLGLAQFDAIAEAAGGGLVAAGRSSDGAAKNENLDALLVKTDPAGKIEWEKRWIGSEDEYLCALAKAPDGTFLAAGASSSNDGDFSGLGGDGKVYDGFAVRFDEQGKVVWERLYHGDVTDMFYAAAPKSDGGFVLAGKTNSSAGAFARGQHPDTDLPKTDLLIATIDEAGDLEDYRCFGGDGTDGATAVLAAQDGRIVAAGASASIDIWMSQIHSTGILRNYEDFDAGLLHENRDLPGDIAPSIHGFIGDCLIVSYDPEAEAP